MTAEAMRMLLVQQSSPGADPRTPTLCVLLVQAAAFANRSDVVAGLQTLTEQLTPELDSFPPGRPFSATST